MTGNSDTPSVLERMSPTAHRNVEPIWWAFDLCDAANVKTGGGRCLAANTHSAAASAQLLAGTASVKNVRPLGDTSTRITDHFDNPDAENDSTNVGESCSATAITHPLSLLIPSLAIASAVLASCSQTPTGDLAHAEQVLATCRQDGMQIASMVDSDESGSRRGSTADSDQQDVIRQAVERTAICGGHFRLSIFSGSTIGLQVYDADMHLDGATDTARLRKAPKAIDAAMDSINEALPVAQQQLDAGQTDIVGQYNLGKQYIDQLNQGGQQYALDLTILTDGIETAQIDLSDPMLTTEQAEVLAGQVPVPDLPGARVRLIGIGRKADGEQLPTPYVEALRAFHLAVCARTNAAECVAVTDAAGA